MAYFISNQASTKGKDPNINIINGIQNIKGKTSMNILVSNYTNKHITFNKEEYVGHLEPPIDEIPQYTEHHNTDEPGEEHIIDEGFHGEFDENLLQDLVVDDILDPDLNIDILNMEGARQGAAQQGPQRMVVVDPMRNLP